MDVWPLEFLPVGMRRQRLPNISAPQPAWKVPANFDFDDDEVAFEDTGVGRCWLDPNSHGTCQEFAIEHEYCGGTEHSDHRDSQTLTIDVPRFAVVDSSSMPRLITCSACRQHVRSEEQTCPHCGAPGPRLARRTLSAGAVLLGLSLAGCEKDPAATQQPMYGHDSGADGSGVTPVDDGGGLAEPEYGVPATGDPGPPAEPDYGVPATAGGGAEPEPPAEPEYGVVATPSDP